MVSHAAPPTAAALHREHGWAKRTEGWPVFAAIVLMLAGVLRLFDAIWAFRYNGNLPDNLEKAIFGHNLETYGWVYLGLALVLFGAGLLVLRASQVARWFGVVAAGLAVWSGIWWMPYYPIWSIAYVAIGVLVIYALTVHGGRAEDYRE